jgi:hypothetical protein
MRIENTLLSQSLVESTKTIEKNELNSESAKKINTQDEESQSFIPSPLGSSGTYSVASLRSAVDYYAKFLTVAENNIQAVQHPTTIPQAILDRLNGR